MPSKPILALGAVLAAVLAAPASATAEAKTRLVDCDAGSCLIVTGRRAHSTSPVSINGHRVPVQGLRKWRAILPVETLRSWSTPNARTITVSVADVHTRTDALAEAKLPIGLLGHEKLAMLIVRVK